MGPRNQHQIDDQQQIWISHLDEALSRHDPISREIVLSQDDDTHYAPCPSRPVCAVGVTIPGKCEFTRVTEPGDGDEGGLPTENRVPGYPYVMDVLPGPMPVSLLGRLGTPKDSRDLTRRNIVTGG
jgi:hypothetical protein